MCFGNCYGAPMTFGILFAALLLIGWVLWDAFETILLPRRTRARARISYFVLRWQWQLWQTIARGIGERARREAFLAFYALLAVLTLFFVWASGLVVGFGLLYVADGARFAGLQGGAGFGACLYMSGTTFFTLGIGDLHATSAAGRLITVVEAGTGFAFLALVIAYVPVLYQAFSRRESRVTMLDEWAGSPPTAAVLLRRWSESGDPGAIMPLLRDWELASADLLESHLSYPILCYFRSQHDNQSWLGSLTAILDTCALVIVGVDGIDTFQARLTFAIGRHALVDVSQALRVEPDSAAHAALDPAERTALNQWLIAAGVPVATGADADRRLGELRALYVPYASRLSKALSMPLAPTMPPERIRFNWETSAWARTADDDGH